MQEEWGGRLGDVAVRIAVGALFALLSVNLFGDFVRTGRMTSVLLLASESLVVVLTVVRRRSRVIDRSLGGAVTTTVSLAGPPLLRTISGAGLVAESVSTTLSAAGLLLVIVGKLALGRSFGLAPANRGIVCAGPYTVVRHPIYVGYLLSHLAFVSAYPSRWNAIIVAVADAALVVRALIEERVLRADTKYREYCERVKWHLLPGVF